MTTADQYLTAVEARTEKATPGPWVHNGVNGIHTRIGACVAISHIHEDQRRWEDAELIAHAPTDLKAMAKALRTVLALHVPVWDRSLVHLDVDPFTRCRCGADLPCKVGDETATLINAVLTEGAN